METNLVPKNSKRIIKYLAIGMAGLAIIGGSYQFFTNLQKRRQRDRVLRILHQTRRDLFPMIKNIKDSRDSMLEELGGQVLPQNLIDELINAEKVKMDAVKRRTALKNGLTPSELDHLVNTVYKDDKDIQLKRDLIAKDLDDVLYKGKIDLETTLPAFLTPQKVIEIDKELDELLLKAGTKTLVELVREGVELSFTNPIVMEKMNSIDIDDEKMEIYKKEGLAHFEDHPDKIMRCAREKYKNADPGFRMAFMQQEQQTQLRLMKAIVEQCEKENIPLNMLS